MQTVFSQGDRFSWEKKVRGEKRALIKEGQILRIATTVVLYCILVHFGRILWKRPQMKMIVKKRWIIAGKCRFFAYVVYTFPSKNKPFFVKHKNRRRRQKVNSSLLLLLLLLFSTFFGSPTNLRERSDRKDNLLLTGRKVGGGEKNTNHLRCCETYGWLKAQMKSVNQALHCCMPCKYQA